ncbi:DUF2062 domain-containing protein [Megalodesulfovibrio gigas]|nr:DUF2062 domain-containing protein [Megalodesulfovibrio gigas]
MALMQEPHHDVPPVASSASNGNGAVRRHSYYSRSKRFFRHSWLKVLRLKTSAHSIAMGAAIGIFIGFLPIIPFQSVAAITLAFIFRANKFAAWLFTFISNPANMVPFYAMLFFVGKFITPFEGLEFDPHNLALKELAEKGVEFLAVMFAGGVVLGIPAAVVTYLVVLNAVLGYRKRRAARLMRRMHAEHEEDGLE